MRGTDERKQAAEKKKEKKKYKKAYTLYIHKSKHYHGEAVKKVLFFVVRPLRP